MIASSKISLGNSYGLTIVAATAGISFEMGNATTQRIGRDEAEQGATRDDLVVERHLTGVARIDLCEFVIDASQSERDLLRPREGTRRS